MKSLKVVLLIFTSFLLSNCSCDERYTCPSIRPQVQYLLNIASDDSLIYSTLFGDTLPFYLNNRYTSPQFEKKCIHASPAGCQCNDCEANASLFMTCDTIFTKKNHYLLRIDERSSKEDILLASGLSIDFMNFRVYFNLMDANNIEPQPLFSPLLQLNGKTFTNVFYFKQDTTNISMTQLPIWELFYTENEGVIGFSARYNQRTYIIE